MPLQAQGYQRRTLKGKGRTHGLVRKGTAKKPRSVEGAFMTTIWRSDMNQVSFILLNTYCVVVFQNRSTKKRTYLIIECDFF